MTDEHLPNHPNGFGYGPLDAMAMIEAIADDDASTMMDILSWYADQPGQASNLAIYLANVAGGVVKSSKPGRAALRKIRRDHLQEGERLRLRFALLKSRELRKSSPADVGDVLPRSHTPNPQHTEP
jgi:hypothetical protein